MLKGDKCYGGKKEKGDGTHTPTHTHIGHEFVNMLLGLITELETFDQS